MELRINKTSKTTLQGFIVVPDSDLEAVIAALPNHIHLTRKEPGCLVFNVTQDPSHPTRFDVYEEFVDQEAFETHQARVRDSDWGRVTVGVERHYTIS